MALHLLKLSVGSDTLDDVRGWAARSADAQAAMGRKRLSRSTTRMAPRRADEVLDGGSLYWVVKGVVQARQPVMGFSPFKDADGIGRVEVFLSPEVVAVRPRPCRPFQGWRYLRAQDAPNDMPVSSQDSKIPPAMRQELMELCLL